MNQVSLLVNINFGKIEVLSDTSLLAVISIQGQQHFQAHQEIPGHLLV